MTRIHSFAESFKKFDMQQQNAEVKQKLTCFVKEVNKETTQQKINTNNTTI